MSSLSLPPPSLPSSLTPSSLPHPSLPPSFPPSLIPPSLPPFLPHPSFLSFSTAPSKLHRPRQQRGSPLALCEARGGLPGNFHQTLVEVCGLCCLQVAISGFITRLPYDLLSFFILAHTHTYARTHHAHTHSITRTRTQSCTRTHTNTHTLNHTHTHTHTHSLRRAGHYKLAGRHHGQRLGG